MQDLSQAINEALLNAGSIPDAEPTRITLTGQANLQSPFRVGDLATATILAAAQEVAALHGAPQVELDRALCARWFDMTLRPQGWRIPPAWDALAGDYKTADGWIKLHTNAPHHRAAALRALGCAARRDAVVKRAAQCRGDELEGAVISQGGAAAQMLSLQDWAAHPQGQAVADEPLIAWAPLKGEARPIPRQGLNGLRVLDLTRVLAGPVATRFLAGFGADVLRIDPPEWAEPGVVPEVTLGKRCAGLDLRVAKDRRRFSKLLREADILVHGYRKDALAGLGFDDEARAQINPGLIEVSLTAYGWTGPWANRRGFDSLVQMSCGIADHGMAHFGAQHPVPLPVQALDHATGYLMAAAAVRAVRWRQSGGGGIRARLSLARTAKLLVDAGRDEPTQLAAATTEPPMRDEMTDWGPARRIVPPMRLDGAWPEWGQQAGPLRRHPAEWRCRAS